MLIPDDGGGSMPPSMNLEVAPEDLVSAAESFEKAANRGDQWLSINAHDLNVRPAGNDQVSKNVAGWLTANAFGPMGAVPAVTRAVQELRAAARQMRDSATTYGIAESGSTAAIGQAGDPT